MSIPRWLSILALSSAVALVSQKAGAETVRQPVIFPDPLEQVVPGRKANANLFINAIKMGNKQIHLSIDSIDCEIVPGSCKLRLALPAKTEVEKITQYGWKKEPGMFWGTNKLKVPLYANEGYQRAVRIIEILGKSSALQATGSMFAMKKTDDLVRIAITGKTRDEAYKEKMRKAVRNLSLIAIPEYTPKNPLGPRNYFHSRVFDFKLSRDPEFSKGAELGFAVLSLVVDNNGKRFAVSDLIVSFNDIQKRAVRPAVGRTPSGIEDLLLKNNAELLLLKEYQEKNISVIEYSYQTPLTPLDIYVLHLKKGRKTKDQVLMSVGKTFGEICERKYPRMMPHTGASLFGIEADQNLVFYLGSIPPPTIKAWRNQGKRITTQELKPIKDKINALKRAAKDRGKTYIDRTEEFFKQLTSF